MYVIYESASEQSGRVVQVVYLPSNSDREHPGRELDDSEMIYPETISGMNSVLMINLETNKLYYDYYVPETVESKVSGLQQENADLNLTLGNLILESANDKATIASLEETVGTLLFEVAALKGGAE